MRNKYLRIKQNLPGEYMSDFYEYSQAQADLMNMLNCLSDSLHAIQNSLQDCGESSSEILALAQPLYDAVATKRDLLTSKMKQRQMTYHSTL